ncbi:hypothetical protein M23134_05284 [Microscilla marina ATCC 23134]|uniref:Uncharacterized protein n=1 Tax=Microscilla marina ATCC 23134 TaxID=313606 RepID=A1ZDN9_MICM2|nr:hypothetical protein M23134_05284 [Microscilla marina ATCC 23134]
MLFIAAIPFPYPKNKGLSMSHIAASQLINRKLYLTMALWTHLF